MWRRYKDFHFLLIGVHTPEFEFEKEEANVRSAVTELGVQWPVALDNDYTNWKNFGCQYWPSNYLFGRDGSLLFHDFGEGDCAQLETLIQQKLKEEYEGLLFPTIEPDGHIHQNACFEPTHDLYCGYARGRLDNAEGYHFDIPFRYRTGNDLRKGSIALLGSFVSKPEYVESAGEGATLLLHFRATEVNLVLKPVEPGTRVKLTFNGKVLSEGVRGIDVLDSSEAAVEKSALYNLINSEHPLEGILGITAQQGNFQAFMFTFSGCLSKK
jgi:hypothetical protein